MNRRSVLRLTFGAAALPLVSLPALASAHLVEIAPAIHFKRGQWRKWNAAEMRYDYAGPVAQYRYLCLLRNDGMALAFPSRVGAVTLAAAKVDAYAQTDGVRDVMPAWGLKADTVTVPQVQVPICGYDGAWPMTEADFKLWVQELKQSLGGW